MCANPTNIEKRTRYSMLAGRVLATQILIYEIFLYGRALRNRGASFSTFMGG